MAKLTAKQINAAYSNAFGKNATAGELKYWVGKEDTLLRDNLRKDPKAGGVYKNYPKTGGGNDGGLLFGGKFELRGNVPYTSDGERPLNADERKMLGLATDRDWQTPEELAALKAKGYTVEDTRPPEEQLADKVNKSINEKTPGWEKDAYWSYLRDYGIEIPELSQKYGVPPDFNYGQSAYGLYETGVAGKRVMGAQEQADQLSQLDVQRREILAQWTDLKERIKNGELDASADATQALTRNLEQKGLAIDQAKKTLSAKGTYFGGIKTKQLGLTEQPYLEQATDINTQKTRTMRDLAQQKGSGQSTYDLAMEQYLGNKKSQFTSYGMEQGKTGQFSSGLEYGGGTWNPTTQKFENIQWGVTPEQAKKQGLEFFGSTPYDLLIADQQKKKELGALGKSGMTEEIGGQKSGLINSLIYGY